MTGRTIRSRVTKSGGSQGFLSFRRFAGLQVFVLLSVVKFPGKVTHFTYFTYEPPDEARAASAVIGRNPAVRKTGHPVISGDREVWSTVY
jgi:hypothetical protein